MRPSKYLGLLQNLLINNESLVCDRSIDARNGQKNYICTFITSYCFIRTFIQGKSFFFPTCRLSHYILRAYTRVSSFATKWLQLNPNIRLFYTPWLQYSPSGAVPHNTSSATRGPQSSRLMVGVHQWRQGKFGFSTQILGPLELAPRFVQACSQSKNPRNQCA